jgi:tubulin-like protein CetZ
MKIIVFGLGQCGGRIADEFARLNSRAHRERGMEIITGAFAVNTDSADLSGLHTINADYQHRILIGGRRTGGHGVGKINELAAEVAREDSDKIVDAIRTAKHFYDTDAFLLTAGVAGGTGSGAMPTVARMIRERFPDKPIYAMAVLPFAHEEQTEERTIYNTATCLKSVNQAVDAVFLVDNQRFIRKDSPLQNNLLAINELIVEPFYDLLCAGEEKKAKNIGSKILDAGDIIQSLSGWTVIGYGQTKLPRFVFFDRFFKNFMKKSAESHRGIQALDEAISELSVKITPAEASRAMYLVTAPAKEMNMDLMKQLADHLIGMSPDAVIRNGDYPRSHGIIGMTLVLSGLVTVEKIRTYYERATTMIRNLKGKRGETQTKMQQTDDMAKDLPAL